MHDRTLLVSLALAAQAVSAMASSAPLVPDCQDMASFNTCLMDVQALYEELDGACDSDEGMAGLDVSMLVGRDAAIARRDSIDSQTFTQESGVGSGDDEVDSDSHEGDEADEDCEEDDDHTYEDEGAHGEDEGGEEEECEEDEYEDWEEEEEEEDPGFAAPAARLRIVADNGSTADISTTHRAVDECKCAIVREAASCFVKHCPTKLSTAPLTSILPLCRSVPIAHRLQTAQFVHQEKRDLVSDVIGAALNVASNAVKNQGGIGNQLAGTAIQVASGEALNPGVGSALGAIVANAPRVLDELVRNSRDDGDQQAPLLKRKRDTSIVSVVDTMSTATVSEPETSPDFGFAGVDGADSSCVLACAINTYGSLQPAQASPAQFIDSICRGGADWSLLADCMCGFKDGAAAMSAVCSNKVLLESVEGIVKGVIRKAGGAGINNPVPTIVERRDYGSGAHKTTSGFSVVIEVASVLAILFLL
ncbi:hypothetical protein HDU77_002314 [Chytriomyces hyalinus]|nr:hypothetical protein HDU77_002314 [Chytriomyces hyalinus]